MKKQIFIALTAVWLSAGSVIAQEKKGINDYASAYNAIEQEEKEALKSALMAINERLEKKLISSEQAQLEKEKLAAFHAKNIELRWAILDNQKALEEHSVALAENKEVAYSDAVLDQRRSELEKAAAKTQERADSINAVFEQERERIDQREDSMEQRSDRFQDDWFSYHGPGRVRVAWKDRTTDQRGNQGQNYVYYNTKRYDGAVLAFGFNNAASEGQDINDLPFKLGRSGFVEFGYQETARLIRNSNLININYGATLVWNKLNIKDNQYFVNYRGQVGLEPFPYPVNKVKFRTTQLVFPVHLQLGGGRGPVLGVGGFGGFTLTHMQKIKYERQGDDLKDKLKNQYNVNEFVYGVSGYVSMGDAALYAKLYLSPLFKNQLEDLHTLSLGLKFDLD
jgi:hypothetical protein